MARKKKTKRKYKKKAGTRKNIFNLLKKRELKGKQINEEELPHKIRYIREQIKQTYKKHNRAQLDGDEDKRAILQTKLETLIQNIKAVSPNLNNEEEIGAFFANIEQELAEELSDSESELAPHEPVFDDDNDSNEGHHSGRSSPSSASSKKNKKKKTKKIKKKKR